MSLISVNQCCNVTSSSCHPRSVEVESQTLVGCIVEVIIACCVIIRIILQTGNTLVVSITQFNDDALTREAVRPYVKFKADNVALTGLVSLGNVNPRLSTTYAQYIELFLTTALGIGHLLVNIIVIRICIGEVHLTLCTCNLMTFLSSFESVGKVNIDNRQVVCTCLEGLNSFSKGLQVVLECCRVCNTCLVSSCGENLSALIDSIVNSSTEGCLVTCTIELI